jgi:hypothetical protein
MWINFLVHTHTNTHKRYAWPALFAHIRPVTPLRLEKNHSQFFVAAKNESNACGCEKMNRLSDEKAAAQTTSLTRGTRKKFRRVA